MPLSSPFRSHPCCLSFTTPPSYELMQPTRHFVFAKTSGRRHRLTPEPHRYTSSSKTHTPCTDAACQPVSQSPLLLFGQPHISRYINATHQTFCIRQNVRATTPADSRTS